MDETRRVCVVYDERMALHRYFNEPGDPDRPSSWIPERPERTTTICKELEGRGLMNRCRRLEARNATRQELEWLHGAEYLDLMEASAGMKQAELNQLEMEILQRQNVPTRSCIYLCKDSQLAALISAGSALQIVDSILKGESRSGVGIIRPPGHHVEGHEAYGFCIYNNTALAAKYALEVHSLERVLIVDWDVHHGNGIQKMFEEDPRVLYISLHRHDTFPWNPDFADCSRVGIGPGEGYNVNIAWPKAGMGDAEYLAAFQRIIMPIAYQFNPQLVLVAAGFDSARGDPVGECDITPEAYGQMTHLLTSFAGGKVAIMLEGGYNLESLSKSMASCVQALLGDPLQPVSKLGAIDPVAAATILRVIQYHRKYWKNLDFDQEEKTGTTIGTILPTVSIPTVEEMEKHIAGFTEKLKQ